MSKKKVYALYKGDTFVDVGTVDELIESNKDISEKYLHWVIRVRNNQKRKPKKNGLFAVLLED